MTEGWRETQMFPTKDPWKTSALGIFEQICEEKSLVSATFFTERERV